MTVRRPYDHHSVWMNSQHYPKKGAKASINKANVGEQATMVIDKVSDSKETNKEVSATRSPTKKVGNSSVAPSSTGTQWCLREPTITLAR